MASMVPRAPPSCPSGWAGGRRLYRRQQRRRHLDRLGGIVVSIAGEGVADRHLAGLATGVTPPLDRGEVIGALAGAPIDHVSRIRGRAIPSTDIARLRRFCAIDRRA